MKFVIRPHSVVDVITNSSTEIFTCQRGHTVRQVEEIINDLLKLYHRTPEEAHFSIDIIEEDTQWEKAGDIIVNLDNYGTPWNLILLVREIFAVEQEED